MIERHAKELAAVIVEPLQRVLQPEPGFLEALREATRRHGIVLIFDEIVTGFRIAWGGAQEKYGVVPDLACYGKAVSGGFPLAAVIVEPLQRVLQPEPGFLEALREATRRHGIVLIFDEIVTGFRIAWGGAQEKYGVVPDLACYGKAVSGGFPLAAVVGREEFMAVLDARKRPRETVVWATHTLNGNPICTAAGCAALDVLAQPGTYAHFAAIGSKLRAGIVAAGARHGFSVQAPGEDAVFGVRFTSKKPLRTWMDVSTADKVLGTQWALELIRRGLLVNPNEKFYISLAHTEADVAHTLAVVDEAFAAIS